MRTANIPRDIHDPNFLTEINALCHCVISCILREHWHFSRVAYTSREGQSIAHALVRQKIVAFYLHWRRIHGSLESTVYKWCWSFNITEITFEAALPGPFNIYACLRFYPLTQSQVLTLFSAGSQQSRFLLQAPLQKTESSDGFASFCSPSRTKYHTHVHTNLLGKNVNRW